MTRTAYLSLGSNLGDREGNLRAALDALGQTVEIVAVSSLYETRPYGVEDQPLFLNIAAAIRTDLDPEDLLSLSKQVEGEVGRLPTFRWGPRVVDVDIVLYDDVVMDTPSLTIPHAGLERRAFVLEPLAEIAPRVRHPVSGRSVEVLRESAPDRDAVLPYQPENRSSAHGSPSMWYPRTSQ